MTLLHTSTHPTRDVLRRVTDRIMHYDFTVWFWGDAIAIDGLIEAAEFLDDPTPRNFCQHFYERWVRRQLSWVDHLTPGGALLRLFEVTGNENFLEAAQRLATWLLEEVPHAPGGVHLYRPDLPPYRHSVWVDTLYHEPPFFSKLAQLTAEQHYYNDALDVWNSHIHVLSSTQGPFLAHSCDTGAGLLRGYGWGRGNGWALYGMIDTLELLPTDHPGRADALHAFSELSTAVLACQDASGFWHTLLQDREAYLESSTAAFFGAAFLKGVRLGILDNRYAEAADRAWHAVLSRIDDDGSFYGVSACTYASVTPENDVALYHTLPTEVNIWGQGSALRFASERIRAGLE